jgi:hypothetical protein
MRRGYVSLKQTGSMLQNAQERAIKKARVKEVKNRIY